MAECLKLITVKHNGVPHQVPCGKCAYCLVNKRSQWQFRIHHEMRNQLHKGYFLTFTYNEKFVKRVGNGRLSLRFRDVQLFFKKVRKHGFYCKYICVGEYGGVTKRPHYHIILWTDCPPEKIQSYWSTADGQILGSVHFGKLNMASAMYCLKYIIQPKELGLTDGLEKTRAQFSRGLGLSYLTAQVYEWHTKGISACRRPVDKDADRLCSYVDGRRVALPRYYRNKIFTKHFLRRIQKIHKRKIVIKNREAIRDLRSKGFENPEAYLLGLRVEQARRIISKTKYNQVL